RSDHRRFDEARTERSESADSGAVATAPSDYHHVARPPLSRRRPLVDRRRREPRRARASRANGLGGWDDRPVVRRRDDPPLTIDQRSHMRHSPYSLALVTLVVVPVLSAQTTIPIHTLGPADATSTQKLGYVSGIHELSDGTVIVNDAGKRRLLAFD